MVWEKIKQIIKIILFILIVVFLFEYFGYKGLWGFIIIFIIFGLWKLWVMRDFFMAQLRNIETIMFSKPLDKDMWNKGEFKKLKVKVNWKKKKVLEDE